MRKPPAYVISGLKCALLFSPTVYYLAEHGYQLTTVHGRSMSPAINPNDGSQNSNSKNSSSSSWLVINKWPKFRYKPQELLHVNDIVYVRCPTDPERLLIKRVKGMQGDMIKTCEVPFQKYPKRFVKVPANHVWIEGDNNFHSIDSNDFGPVSIGLIEAKVVGKVGFGWEFPFVVQPISSEGGREARLSRLSEYGQ